MAYIASASASRYPIEELLHLRTSLPVVTCIIDKLNKHPDIDVISRIPYEAMNKPELFSCKSSSLADINNRRQLAKYSSESSEEKFDGHGAHSRRASRSHSSKWSLRRRNSSDRSSQPHSAPSGPDAQHSENFKKFYKAVTSPTHIRVTAGGRIVPNTRAAPPPAFEWNAEEHHFNQNNTLSEQESSQQSTNSLPSSLLPQGFLPLPSTYLPPYGFMPQINPMALPMHSPQPGIFAGNDQNSIESGKSSNENAPQQIKISPPTQFDQTKPFMINGQVVYPYPPPNAVPVNMIGNPNFAPPHFPMPWTSFPTPMALPPGHQFPMIMPAGPFHPENIPNMASLCPVTGSTFMKSQIQSLQNNANYIRSQIANTQQPMEVMHLQNQHGIVLAQLRQMESMLEVQLAQENAAKPGKPSGEGTLSDTHTHHVSQREKSPAVVSSSQYVAQLAKKPTLRSAMEDSAKQQDPPTTEVPAVHINEMKPSTRSGSTSKSRLSAAAAKAPPFQPRAQLAATQAPRFQQDVTLASSLAEEDETQEEIEQRLLSRATTDWSFSAPGGFANNQTEKRHPSLPKALSMNERSGKPQNGYQLPRALTFHGKTDFIPQTMAPTIHPQSTPYLVGVVPKGIASHEVKPSDVVYNRPLTEKELRARQKYWGKLPRSPQYGLPKFDGKDFYPPSPVKASAITASAGGNPTINGAGYFQELNLPNSFPELGVPDYRAFSSARLQMNQPNLLPPMQPFVGNGVGTHTNWSAQYPPRREYGRGPFTPPAVNASGMANGSVDLSVHPATKQTIVNPNSSRSDLPVTPKNPEFREEVEGDEDDTDTLDSWGGPVASERGLSVIEEARNDEGSNDSTVEIHLSPQTKQRSPKPVFEGSFAERVASFSNADQQTLFLQNMLKKQTTMAMSGPVLSGEVSSATATGYLPHYHGSAAASLAPTIGNVSGSEREPERPASKSGLSREFMDSPAQFNTVNLLSENRPLSGIERSTRPSPEHLGAADYMRYLSQRAEDDKKVIERVLNSNTQGTGPITGSDW